MKLYEYAIKLKDQATEGLRRFKAMAGASGDETTRLIRRLSAAERQAMATGTAFGGMGRTIRNAVAGVSFAFLSTQVFTLGAEAEQTRIAFDVLLGSAQKSAALRADLQKFADKSPFSTKETYAAGESLLAFGVKSKDLLPIMGRLGDLAKGNGVKFQGLVDNYGKAVSATRANTIDLNQFAIAGVPIWDSLTKVVGKSGLELRKYVEQNGVSIPQLNKAFEMMTSKGGKFFGMMEKQSQSSLGKWSKLTSQVETKVVKLFNRLQPLINRMIDFGGSLLSNGKLLRELATVLAFAGLAYVSFNAVVIGSAAAMAVYNKWLILSRIANVFLARGITLTNLAMLASPAGWITAGILALTAGIIYAWNNFEGFRGAVVGLWEAFKQLMTNLVSNFLPVFRTVAQMIQELMNGNWGKAAMLGAKALAEAQLGTVVFLANTITGKTFKGVGDAYKKGDAAGRKMGKIGLGSFLPGMAGMAGAGGAAGGGEGGSSEATTPEGMKDITGGGSKPLVVNISFRNFIENSTISAATARDGVEDLTQQLRDAFGRIIDGGVSSVGR